MKTELAEVKDLLKSIKFATNAQQPWYVEPLSSSSPSVLHVRQRLPRQEATSHQESLEFSHTCTYTSLSPVPSPPPLPPPLQLSLPPTLPPPPCRQSPPPLPSPALHPPKYTASATEKPTCTDEFSTTFLVDMKPQSSSRPNFAARLVRSLYTIEERKTSNVKGILGKNKLSPTRLGRIKNATMQMYPCISGENEVTAWRACCKAVDETCRRLNRKGKENITPRDWLSLLYPIIDTTHHHCHDYHS